MKTKTIKLKENEYTSFTTEFDEHDLIIFSGARGAGKSYPVAKHITKMLIQKKDSKFAYIRINKKELFTFFSWANDMELDKISGYPHNKLFRGKPHAGDILLRGYESEEDAMLDNNFVYERIIGMVVSLENSSDYKSGNYSDFVAFVFEEYLQKNMNPAKEKDYVFHFIENVKTFFREREKHIFVMGNTLKSIPTFDRAIDELTPDIFKNPLKIKIFREYSKKAKENEFLAYLSGEVYDDDEFIPKIEEFWPIYMNKKYIVYEHLVYTKKFYVQHNKLNKSMSYREREILALMYFCRYSPANEFYYQDASIEKNFTFDYFYILREITALIAEHGTRFIV